MRQRARTGGPLCADTLANTIVKLNMREMEALFNEALDPREGWALWGHGHGYC
jgi:hypothetical protein